MMMTTNILIRFAVASRECTLQLGIFSRRHVVFWPLSATYWHAVSCP